MNDGPTAGAVDPTQAAAPGGGGSFLTRLAPTIGGVLGGIGGELIDPFGGGIAGAALGSGLGKAVQNESQGKGIGLGSDLTAGVEGGIGQGLGYGAGALLGKLGGALGNYGTRALENSKVADEFSNLSPAIREKLNLDNSLNLADQAGIPKTAAAFSELPNAATGANGVLNGTLDMLVNKAAAESGKGIDLNGFRDAVSKAIEDRPELGSLVPTTGGRGGLPQTNGLGARLQAKMDALLQQHGFSGEGSLTGVTNPDNGLQLLREVHRLGGGFDNALTESGQAQKYVYNQVENFLKDKLYNSPEVKQAIANYTTTPEDEAAILKATGGNQKFANFITNTLNNAKSSKDITNVERQLIDMRDAGNTALVKNANVLPGEQADSSGDIINAGHHILSGNKLAAMASVLKSGGNVSARVAKKSADLLDRIGRVTGPAGAALATLPNAAQGGSNQGVPMNPTANVTPTQGQAPNAYDTLLSTVMAASILDPGQFSSMGSNILGGALPSLQKSAATNAMLGGLEGQFGAAGGGQGMGGGGILDAILSRIPGTPQNAAMAQKNQLAQTLGINPAMGPSFLQSPTTAGGQIGTIQNLISSLGGGGVLGTVPGQ